MSLEEVWEGAAGSPFSPLVAKEYQFFVGFSLLLTGQCALSSHVSALILTPSSFNPDWALWIE